MNVKPVLNFSSEPAAEDLTLIPNTTNTNVSGSCCKILDKDGIEMPDDWAVTPRTYEKVKRLLDRLNVNGEYRPYTMVRK